MPRMGERLPFELTWREQLGLEPLGERQGPPREQGPSVSQPEQSSAPEQADCCPAPGPQQSCPERR
jgi:hypothetical protein